VCVWGGGGRGFSRSVFEDLSSKFNTAGGVFTPRRPSFFLCYGITYVFLTGQKQVL
jgi:hypothetical protein